MTDSIIKLFSYENRLDLLYVDNQIRSNIVTNNSPLNKRVIKIHKGVDNQVRFRILNPDRKRVSVDHLSIRARLINAENQERVLERFAEIEPNSKGDVRLTIFEGDLINLAAGFYTLVVTGQEALVPGSTVGENVNTPFFIDNAGAVVATVEIVDDVDVTPYPTVTLLPDDWRPTTTPDPLTRQSQLAFMSSAIPGARIRNHLNAVHSFSVRTTGFTGTVELRGTLELQPPSDPTNYFPIDITSAANIIEFSGDNGFTGITSHTFDANFMWIIFIYKPDMGLLNADLDFGTVDKILLR